MKAITLRQPAGLDKLHLVDLPDPGQPGAGEIRVRVHASSLNFHDLGVVTGRMPSADGRIPMSDGAGVVEAIGEGVDEFAVGDSVVSTFFPTWLDGGPTLSDFATVPGDGVDGYAREWVRAMNIITHGETGNGGLSWGKIELRSLRKHRSFASMNGAAVFDDNVRKEKLESLKLCFLCGRQISPETLTDVRELVRENGLTVVATKKYMPKDLETNGFFIKEAKDGSGVWINPVDLRLPQLRKRLAAFTGEKGEMTYRFGGKTVKMKIDKDGEGFELI